MCCTAASPMSSSRWRRWSACHCSIGFCARLASRSFAAGADNLAWVDLRCETGRRQDNFGHETEAPEQTERQPSHIDFPPFVALSRRAWIGMMIVVPFAANNKRHENVVAALVGRLVIAVTPKMRHRIDRPRQMPDRDRAQDRAPHQKTEAELNRSRRARA